jgi:hypothetical protein
LAKASAVRSKSHEATTLHEKCSDHRRHYVALGVFGDGADATRGNGSRKSMQARYQAICGNVPPGRGRIKTCMKAHIAELSEPCKEALFQAWLRQ